MQKGTFLFCNEFPRQNLLEQKKNSARPDIWFPLTLTQFRQDVEVIFHFDSFMNVEDSVEGKITCLWLIYVMSPSLSPTFPFPFLRLLLCSSHHKLFIIALLLCCTFRSLFVLQSKPVFFLISVKYCNWPLRC